MIRTSCHTIVVAGFGMFSAANAIAQPPPPPNAPTPVTDLVYEAPKVIPEAIVSPTAIAVPERLPPEVAAPLQVDNSEAFIDHTNYSIGATNAAPPISHTALSVPAIALEQEVKPQQAAVAAVPEPAPSIAAVEIGPVHLSAEGIGWQPPERLRPESSPPMPENVVNPGRPYFPPSMVKPFEAPQRTLDMRFPVAIPAPITSIFGWRIHPISGAHKLHTGSDIGAPMGTPVLAASTGKVIFADTLGGYGLAIALEHQEGMQQTLYAHLSELFVKPGEIVQQGTVIGRVGSTGAATGPHLHFELRQMTPQGWVAIDAGKQLEIAMGQLVQSLQIAQAVVPGRRH